MAEEFMIKGPSKGYKRGMIFELTNGRKWKQTSSQYLYSYLHRPSVLMEISGSHGRLRLSGMNAWVDVKRIR